MTNYYATLEVPVGSDISAIREAYRRLVQENLWNKEVFADLKEAYEVLSTPARRAEYDNETFGQIFSDDTAGAQSPSVPNMEHRCPVRAGAQCPVVNSETPIADTFCPECGFLLASLPPDGFSDSMEEADPAERPHLVETLTERIHRLHIGLNTVGREAADILLTDKTVSRRHANVEMTEDGSLFIEDLGSTNGSRVQDSILKPNARIGVADGDAVRFGSISLTARIPKLSVEQKESPPQIARGADVDQSPAESSAIAEESEHGIPNRPVAHLVGERHGTIVRNDPMVQGVTTFGRRSENNIVLRDDPYISGMHAQIIADEDMLRLTDLGSTNGTFLNGTRMVPNEATTLRHGDMIAIGDLTYRVDINSAVQAIAPTLVTADEASGERETDDNDA